MTSTEAFLDAFFGPGNTVWPDRDPASQAGRRLQPLLQRLDEPGEVPAVLPRRRPTGSARPGPLLAYVIAWNAAHAAVVAELLTAFVGPSYAAFDGRPARLDPRDPVDRAVLDLVGTGCAFVLTSPTQQTAAQAWNALELLQDTVARRPDRNWMTPKPIGRLLAEFELALAAGDAAASANVLDQVRLGGGLSGLNLAHLQVKRLSRLGRDDELLRLAALSDVVAARPPTPVTNAILAAIYQTALANPLTAGNIRGASDRLMERGYLVPALLNAAVEDGATTLDAEARATLCVAAWIRRDPQALRQLLEPPTGREQVGQISPALLTELLEDLERSEEAATPTPKSPDEPPTPITSWPEWVRATIANTPEAKQPHQNEDWRTWAPPVASDHDLAALMSDMDDASAERLWSLVGAFVDADSYQRPAASTAREFLGNAMTYGRFSPADLAGVVALTDLVLRAAPPAADYTDLLDDLRAECDRWVGPERANVALDLADLLVRAACPDTEARLRLALALLTPLHAHQGRLDPSEAAFAQQLSSELATGLEWAPPTDDEAPSAPPAPATILLYSLDQAVLARVTDALATQAPGSKVHRSHDYVGTDQLKQRARNADAIALATRCAKHAATGFIRAYARPDATIVEADGSGSASLLRATIRALRLRATSAADG